MQTNLKTDDFCGFNQAAAPYFWTFQPGQYNNNYVYGEVGVLPQGGAAGSYVPGEVIGISSFLSGRENILTKCMPPTPALSALQEPILYQQNEDNANMLIPLYTKEKKSNSDLDSINYNRWDTLYEEPQNIRYVIPELSGQRGGLDTREFVKKAWNPKNQGPGFADSKETCEMTLFNPNQLMSDITGYPGTNPITGTSEKLNYFVPGKPPNDPNYPFDIITSQQITEVGGPPCGLTYFSGPNYDIGSCHESYLPSDM
jgi:hypothetical protein